MSKKSDECVVLFADITDSTRLYEKYGDNVAKANIDICLGLLERITKEYKGTVIKTIGDEIMCTFPYADYAYLASCTMHELVTNHPSLQKLNMMVQIGFHSGYVIKDNNDVFGDTVNVAARIASLANATKTLITKPVFDQLSIKFKNQVRPYDQVSIKGKLKPVSTWEILWKKSDDEMTVMVNKPHQRKSNSPTLTLNYEDKTFQLQQDFLPLVIGRTSQATIFVNSKLVSRTHLIIEYIGGNFTLTDKSTNGTYIKPMGGKTLFLKNEQILLHGQGEISLGEPFVNNKSQVINYS